MYRVMIIDDEMSARKLLQASIDWQALNMKRWRGVIAV